MTLVALVLAWTLAAPPPPPTPLFEYGTDLGGARRILLGIARDGRWQGASETDRGALTQDEIAALGAAIDKTELIATRGPPCPGTPGRLFLRVARGEVVWSSGCGLVPHTSVLALVELAESFTTRRPPPVLVRVRRQRVGSTAGEETVELMRAGAWTTHRARGMLDQPTLAAIIAAFDAALLEAPPIERADVCRGDYPHHVDVPGRGEVRYIWPCALPSPTLAHALELLYRAVGLTAP